MKKYIQPRNYVVDIVMESLLTSMSASSESTTDDFWTNKKNQEEDNEEITNLFWSDTEF